ncbi:unnamed protein product [Prorocentrum cordatum]|uniref:Uncharacterized protein n=1 Tax=Prorocentrum cordatum TaxID=2364126 RepID=A0ABN9VH26_9DINO|nr:unnamed protein product [Polarella glacialis]|mmetsp:Transcript_63618/g.180656  ORF Transcript_63618/g.180656 Transcript_63618/m.180656 type:complete len:343 (+) Transcript_63618:72-1100(+)
MSAKSVLLRLLAPSLIVKGLCLQSSQKDEDLLREGIISEEDWLDGYKAGVRHIGNISVVTVETRAGNPMKLPGRNAGNSSDSMVTNVGAGEPWKFYRTKNGLMLKWLEDAVQKDPEAIAIMIDGGDMILGGCDEAFIRQKYGQILKASGGGPDMTLVMSAETACFPWDMGWRFRESALWEQRRSAVDSQVENLSDDWVVPWSPCGDHKIAPCDGKSSRAYRYPNWGFVMGPVRDLKPLFEWVYNNGGKKGELDQLRAQWWMLSNPDKITLDYTGSLVLSIHQMAWGRPDSQAPIEIARNEEGQPVIRNKILGQPCCFAHGNGDGEGLINRMIGEMGKLTAAV